MHYVSFALIRSESIAYYATNANLTPKEFLNQPKLVIETLRRHAINTTQQLQAQYAMNHCRYQLNELIGMFCGRYWRITYEILFGCAVIIQLWSFATVFGLSLTQNISMGTLYSCNIQSVNGYTSGCRALYSIFILIFWVWIMFVTSMNFKHQRWLQIFATFFRFINVVIMSATSIAFLYSNVYYDPITGNFDSIIGPNANTAGPHYGPGVSAWKWNGLSFMIAVTAVAYGNQYCVTDVNRSLHREERYRRQTEFWTWNVTLCMICFSLPGICISLYLGANTLSPCTLIWKNFHRYDTD
jgi:hypothetical protein